MSDTNEGIDTTSAKCKLATYNLKKSYKKRTVVEDVSFEVGSGEVVGLLGLANWEMVNVYLGTAKDLSLVNVMAYFKRPVQAGRSVGDPKIKL